MANEHFFPPIDPHETGNLQVDGVHNLYWETCGNPEGEPILFIHGGPGAGCSETDRRFFHPDHFLSLLVDQRGFGRSRPIGELDNHSIEHLVADLVHLLDHLGYETLHLFFGSWCSTLWLYSAH